MMYQFKDVKCMKEIYEFYSFLRKQERLSKFKFVNFSPICKLAVAQRMNSRE
jgi:hypothetical protein